MANDLRETVSALLDEELSVAELQALYEGTPDRARLANEQRRLAAVGAAMRNEWPVVHADLLTRVSTAIDEEPTVLAPRALPRRRSTPRWTWASLAAAASVAAIAFVQWRGADAPLPAAGQLVASVPIQDTRPVAASVTSRASVPSAAERDRLDSLLLRHNELAAQHMKGLLPYTSVVSFTPND